MNYARMTMSALLAAVLVLGMTGCAGNQLAGSDATSAESAPEQQEQPEETSTAQLAAAAYREVLADPVFYCQLDKELVPDPVTFSYALVNMDDGDTPQLLVRATSAAKIWSGMEPIRVFSYDAESNELIAPAYDIQSGTASGGGYRGGITYSPYGKGLLHSQISSGTGEGYQNRITLSDGNITETFLAAIDLGSDSVLSKLVADAFLDIPWVDASDSSALDTLEANEWQSTVTGTPPDATAAAQNAGLSVFTGTVRILDVQGVVDLQGQPDPNPGIEESSDYVVLDLGSEQQIYAVNGDGDGFSTRSTSMILLDHTGNDRLWEGLDGKQTTIALDPTLIGWQSDASLPLGALRCSWKGIAVIG